MRPVATYDTDRSMQLDFLCRVAPVEVMGPGTPHRLIWSNEFYIDSTGETNLANIAESDPVEFIVNHADSHASNDRCHYYAPAVFDGANWDFRADGKQRGVKGKTHVRFLKSFWIDIDASPECPTPAAIRAKFNEFADETDMLGNNIEWMEVESGAGIHFYLPLDAPITDAEWQPVADALKEWLVDAIGADDKPIANRSSLLRLPGTVNRKRLDSDNVTYKYAPAGKEVRWLTDVSAPNALADIKAWLAANKHEAKAPTFKTAAAIIKVPQKPVTDIGLKKMRDGCAVMRSIIGADNPDLHYSDWFNTLTLVSKSDDPGNVIENWLPQKTAAKTAKHGDDYVAKTLARWNDEGYPPPKCSIYNVRNKDACKGCILAGKEWARPTDLAVDPYEDLNDLEKSCVARLTELFDSLGMKYASILDRDVPLNMERIFTALGKCYMTNKDNNLIRLKPSGSQHLIKDNAERLNFLQDIAVGGGSFFRNLDAFIRQAYFGHLTDEEYLKVPMTSIDKVTREFKGNIARAITNSFWDVRNPSTVDIKVDIFADEAKMEMDGKSKLKVSTPFLGFAQIPVVKGLGVDDIDEIIADYKNHFPQFDEFIDFICHGRFAPTRKYSYLWLVCPSDWGKSFLMGLFGHKGLGIMTTTKTDTIKDMVNGTTSGFTTEGLSDKWIMFFDEASGAPKELKDFNDEVVFTPKWGSQTMCVLYNKVFACTNLPASLIEFGSDPQLTNRFAMIRVPRKAQTLTDREVFQRDTEAYRTVLLHYVKNRMDAHVAKMRGLGQHDAGRLATKAIAEFNAKYPLTSDGGITATLQEIVQSAMTELVAAVSNRPWHGSVDEPVPLNRTDGEPGIHEYFSYANHKGKKYVRIQNHPQWLQEHVAKFTRGAHSAKFAKSRDDLAELAFDTIQMHDGDYHSDWSAKLCEVVNGVHQYVTSRARGWYVPYDQFPQALGNIKFPWMPADAADMAVQAPETSDEALPAPKRKPAATAERGTALDTDESAE